MNGIRRRVEKLEEKHPKSLNLTPEQMARMALEFIRAEADDPRNPEMVLEAYYALRELETRNGIDVRGMARESRSPLDMALLDSIEIQDDAD
jgi:Spy/CpxP family protein refolding chaperone